MQVRRITPYSAATGIGVVRCEDMHIDAALADFQCGFQCLNHASAFRVAGAQPVLHYFKMAFAFVQEARVTLRSKQRFDFVGFEIRRYRNGEGNRQPRIAGVFGARGHGIKNGLWRVAHHLCTATFAIQMRSTGEQQLQVIVEFRHRAHGRARGAHWIDLIDGDGGRDAVDAVDLWPVLAIKELACVWREGFDITPLALGVQGIEHQRRFAAAGDTGDDDQLVQR